MKSCLNLAEYLSSERLQLSRAISEHKWYLSERAGHDVGYQVAEQHFIEHVLPAVADNFRMKYCENCENPTRCAECHAEHLKAS